MSVMLPPVSPVAPMSAIVSVSEYVAWAIIVVEAAIVTRTVDVDVDVDVDVSEYVHVTTVANSLLSVVVVSAISILRPPAPVTIPASFMASTTPAALAVTEAVAVALAVATTVAVANTSALTLSMNAAYAAGEFGVSNHQCISVCPYRFLFTALGKV